MYISNIPHINISLYTIIANTRSATIPLFSEHAKFDGTNWPSWKQAIIMIINSREAEGYLNSSIVNPVSLNPLPTITATGVLESVSITASSMVTPSTNMETLWDLPTPTTGEQRNQNSWAKMLLIFNTIELTGLGIDADIMAANT